MQPSKEYINGYYDGIAKCLGLSLKGLATIEIKDSKFVDGLDILDKEIICELAAEIQKEKK